MTEIRCDKCNSAISGSDVFKVLFPDGEDGHNGNTLHNLKDLCKTCLPSVLKCSTEWSDFKHASGI